MCAELHKVGSSEEKLKVKNKTIKVILPLVQQYHPVMVYDEVLSRFD